MSVAVGVVCVFVHDARAMSAMAQRSNVCFIVSVYKLVIISFSCFVLRGLVMWRM